MTDGVFAVARGIFDHEFFAHEPFSEREAWIWLISEAAWKPRRVRNGPIVVNLARGECCFSIRYLAEAWRWHRSRVQRFLARLKTETMIGTRAETGVTIITICKYSEFQFSADRSETASETAVGTKAKKIITSDTNVSVAEAAPIDIRQVLFTDGLESLKRQTGKPDATARKIIGGWLKAAKDDAAKVLVKIRQAEADRVLDAVAWVTAALRDQTEYQFLWARG